MIEKLKKQLDEFHKELCEAFENDEKRDQLYASNITITMGSQTIELPFMPETLECITNAFVLFIHEHENTDFGYND